MNGVLLGKEIGTDKEIYLSSDARRYGSYMVGLQGMGKTNLLLQIALQNIENGDGLCVLSPHGDLITELLKRIPDTRRDDVIVFDPASDYPVGINIFEWDGKTPIFQSVSNVADQVVEIFKQVWGDKSWGPQLEEVMYMTAQTIFWAQTLPPDKRPTIREFMELLSVEVHTPYLDFILDHIRETHTSSVLDDVFEFWRAVQSKDERRKSEYLGSTRNKVRPFRSNLFLGHVFGQSSTGIDLGDVMEQGRILLCDLDTNKLGSGNVGMFGSLLVSRLFLAGLAREKQGDISQSKPFHIIADEFRYFALSAFDRIQDELRKFDVTVLLAHQRRGQLNDTMKSATITARNWIVMAVNPEDARELSDGFDSTPREIKDRVKQQDFIITVSPWDELRKQGHNSTQVMDTFHYIDDLVFGGWRWVGNDTDIENFLSYAGDLINRSGKKRGYYEKFFRGFKSRDLNIEYRASALTTAKPMVLAGVNKYLYYRMMKRENDSKVTLQDLLPVVFSIPDMLTEGDSFKKATEGFPQIYIDTNQDEVFKKIIPVIIYFVNQDGFWDRITEYQMSLWVSVYLIYQYRFYFRDHLIRLGDLLVEQPVYVRGGAPLEPEGSQRNHSDVTAEWQNRFAHLPQFEAWVKVQEERSIAEYHIETKEIDPVIRSDDDANQLREQSSQKYGINRDEVEKQIRRRTSLEDDELDAYEDLSDDESDENLDDEG